MTAPSQCTIRELLPPETPLAFAAMSELHTDLRDEKEFVLRIDEVQRPEGYRLIGRFVGSRVDAVAVAGFRVGHSLAWGRFLYVDDLCTVSTHRGECHGEPCSIGSLPKLVTGAATSSILTPRLVRTGPLLIVCISTPAWSSVAITSCAESQRSRSRRDEHCRPADSCTIVPR